MTTELDPFETRVLTALRAHVTERAGAPGPAPARRRTARWWVAGLGAAATVAVAAVVAVPGLGPESAYSVQEGNADRIEVEINRPEDAAGLERALEGHGIDADITYLPDLQTCAPGRFTEVRREVDMMLSSGAEDLRVTLGPGSVRDGETFVLVWSVVPMTDDELAGVSTGDDVAVEGHHTSISAEVAAGPVEPCRPVPRLQGRPARASGASAINPFRPWGRGR